MYDHINVYILNLEMCQLRLGLHRNKNDHHTAVAQETGTDQLFNTLCSNLSPKISDDSPKVRTRIKYNIGMFFVLG